MICLPRRSRAQVLRITIINRKIRLLPMLIVDEIILILDKEAFPTYTLQSKENNPGPFLIAVCGHHWLSCLASQAYGSVRKSMASLTFSLIRMARQATLSV